VSRSLLFSAAGLLIAAAAGLVGGCSTQPPTRLAPPIPGDQQDITRYITSPCDLLRADRVARQHLNPPGAVVSQDGGRGCQWAPTDSDRPTITASGSTTFGLEELYRRRADFSSFQPTEIAHYPAVDTTTDPRGPTSGSCMVHVGVADGSTVRVTAAYGAAVDNLSTDPCRAANSVATVIIGQLLAGTP
jgi:hypothetical protein